MSGRKGMQQNSQYMSHRAAAHSDQYQFKYQEFVVDFTAFKWQSLEYEHNPNEPLLREKKMQLVEEVMRIAEAELTPKQAQAVKLYYSGLPQVEVAKLMGVAQTSTFKILKGNAYYVAGKKAATHGGAIPKLIRLCREDKRCQQLLDEISELL
jgi:hypothetical protein